MTSALDEIQRRVNKARDEAIKRGDGRQEKLTADEKRVLEYFWNHVFQAEVPSVPAAAIYFGEGRRLHPDPGNDDVRELITIWIKALMTKGYVQPDFSVLTDMKSAHTAELRLAAYGREFLTRGRVGWLTMPVIFASRQLKLWQFLAAVVGIVGGSILIFTRIWAWLYG